MTSKTETAAQRRRVVEKRGEFHFAVLSPNPDAGKEGVCYSGNYFTCCTTDGLDVAVRIAKALNLLDAVENQPDPRVVE